MYWDGEMAEAFSVNQHFAVLIVYWENQEA